MQNKSITTDYEWKPTSDIIVYWKLEGDTQDYSGHNRTGTASGITYESNGHIQVAKFANGSYVQRQDSVFDIYGTTPFTFSGRFKPTSLPSGSYSGQAIFNSFGIHETNSQGTQDKAIEFRPNGVSAFYGYSSNPYRAETPTSTIAVNNRYNITGTYDGTNLKIYVNAVLKGTKACPGTYNFSNPILRLSRQISECYSYIGYVSRFRVSNKARTDTEVSNYVNKVKSKFGL